MTDASGDLCFGEIPESGEMPVSCIKEPDVAVGRTISWAPDGKTILTIGIVRIAADGLPVNGLGIVRYTSEKPFSPNPGDWGQGKFVSPVDEPRIGVAHVAYSPDGRFIALAHNYRGGNFRLGLAKADDLALKDMSETTFNACEVSWRPDGLELAIVTADVTTCGLDDAQTSRFGNITPLGIRITEQGATVSRRARRAARQRPPRRLQPQILGMPADGAPTQAAPLVPGS